MEQASRRPKVAIVASEPLSHDRHQWLPIPSNSLVIINKCKIRGEISSVLITPFKAAMKTMKQRKARLLD